MINLNAYEEKLYRQAMSYISQSGITNDLNERDGLLKEAINIIEEIRHETENKKE